LGWWRERDRPVLKTPGNKKWPSERDLRDRVQYHQKKGGEATQPGYTGKKGGENSRDQKYNHNRVKEEKKDRLGIRKIAGQRFVGHDKKGLHHSAPTV